MANRIQLRRGGAQEWANSNPTLAQGELGIELDTGRFKIGDGVSAWNSLQYSRPVESTSNTANTLVQRDADGNFAAGTITATLIGNASTAARLASTRQIQLSDDIQGSGVFDGSANLTLSTSLQLVSTLPHYDGTAASSATYTKVTVDAKGRITNASNPTTLAAYGLDGTVEGTSAQPYDLDLVAVAGLTTTGLIARTSGGSMATRTVTGTATRIAITNGDGVSGNPTIDLITTAVTGGDYNTASTTSVAGSETVNAGQYSIDTYGRITAAATIPIATATEGTLAAAYNAGTTYSRGDKITNASKLYQAITGISAGAGAPTHSDTSDAGSWRHLGASATPQKGLASFDQEDFDVSAAGHVTFATAGIDNTQLQNSRISFADGNAKEDFDLDQELTTTTGYRGFNKLNYIKINDTSGNLLFGANNTGDSSAGEIDVNVRSYFSDPDITLDGTSAQTLDKTGDGNLTFQTTQDSSSARTLSILATNAGTGASGVVVTAENTVTITASDAAGKVQVEDTYFQGDYIGSSAATMILDPGDDRAVSGKVQIMGDLQVDGTTTTINSSVTTLDDPIITLGGDTAPASDDNKDRGVEFRYYDASAKVGFFGYDDSAVDLGGHTGAFSFLYDATNTSEVFAGTDAGIVAGNLKLTTNTNSTSNTTGDLVVAGGAGIGDDVNIGGLLDVDGTFRANSTSRFDDDIVFQGASKTLKLNNGSGTTKTTLHTTTGNAEFGGIVTTTGAIDANSTLNVASEVYFESTNAPDIVSGAPHTIQNSDYGAFRCDGGGYFDKAVLFNGDIFLNGDFNQQEDATENYGLRNYLSIRYKLRAGSVGAYTPSYSNHNTSNLRVFGGAGVNTTLHVGGTGSGEGFFVGKKVSGDTVKFSVLGASGNTTIVGTLNVNDAVDLDSTLNVDAGATFQDNVTINADNKMFTIENNSAVDQFTVDTDNGNTLVGGTLTVDDAAELNSTLNVDLGATFQDNVTINADNKFFKVQNNSSVDKFTVDTDNGNTTIGGTLDVTSAVGIDGDFDIATNKFTVASASGNTVIDGTLDVDEQVTITSGVTINDANKEFLIQNGSAVSKFSVDTDNGNTNIIGTLTVGDATQINDTFGTSGVNTFTNNTEQTLTGSYAADGSARYSGGIGLAKNLAVGGGARVYGNTELTGTLDLNNDADISGNLVVSNTQDASSLADGTVALQVAGGATIDKNTYVGGNFVVYDAGNTRAAFTVTNSSGDAELHNNLTVGGNLIVNGSTTTVNSTVTTLDDPIITLGGDTAPGSDDAKDRGVEFRYYDGSAKIGFFGFDRSSQEFAFLTTVTNTSEVMAGTDGALRVGSVHVTGAGTAVDIDNNLNVDGTATVDGQIISNLASGTAPFSVASTTKVSNLNADLLDGATTATAATVSTVVLRDGSGDFAANQITAASAAGAGAGFLGNASSADIWKTARTLTIDGVVDGSVSIDGSAAVTLTTTYNDADITALAAMSGTGYVVRTAANTYAQRTLAVTASSGITLTNADGVSGNTTINVASSDTNAANNLVLRDSSGNFAAGTITADLTGTASIATTVTVADESTDTSCNVLFTTAATGNLAPKSGTNLTFNSNTGILTATGFAGPITGEVTGNAATATALATARNIGGVSFDGTAAINLPGVNAAGNQDTSGTAALATEITTTANNSTDETVYPVFVDGATGAQGAETDTGLTYNPSSGELTSTQFTGALSGNASTATTAAALTTARTIGGTSFDGSADIAVGLAATSTALATARNIGGTSFDGTADITPATATQATNLSNHNTGALTEGTNLYYTEARVQAKLDNAYAQLQAMLNNLATATTLTLNLSGDPTPGVAVTLGSITASGLGGFTGATNVSTSGGTGSALTVDTTVNAAGAITAIALNTAGSDYLISDTLTITNPNLGGVSTLNLGTLAGGTGYANGTAIATTSSGSGTSCTLDITTSNGVITNASVNAAGSGYAIGETLTIVNANASGVKTLGTIATAGTGYATGSAIATTSSGSGTGLTVDIAQSSGVVTGVTINGDGSGYAASEVITITNANASGIATTGNVSAADAARTPGTYTIGASDYITQASGALATFTIDIAVGGGATITAVTNDGSGFIANETITVADANLGGGGAADLTFDVTAIHGNGATIPVSAIHGNGASLNTATVFTNATFALGDITTMEVGATVTGGTSGTTGVITALGATSVTVDNVDGFFKVGETVGANDVTNLTISSFA